MNKHTPGPWAKTPFGKMGFLILHNHHSLAHVNGKQGGEQVEANARLMAAAPAMLEALEALQGVEAWINDPEMKRLVSKTITQAIEKATL
jgi:hypothetical protein